MFDVLDLLEYENPGQPGKVPCPFHEETTPSCHVYDDHWWSYCCGKGGSVIDFVMAFYGCSFARAMQVITTADVVDETRAPKARVDKPAERPLVEQLDEASCPFGLEHEALAARRWPTLAGRGILHSNPARVQAVHEGLAFIHWNDYGIAGVKVKKFDGRVPLASAMLPLSLRRHGMILAS